MVDRLLIVEQDPEDPAVWRYGLADGTGELVDAAHLRHDPLTGSVPLDGQGSNGLWPTRVAPMVRGTSAP
jgi:hypothetical protein